jgi:hypothetical protein
MVQNPSYRFVYIENQSFLVFRRQNMVKESEWKEKEENLENLLKQFETSIVNKQDKLETNFENPNYWTKTTDASTSFFTKTTDKEMLYMNGSQPEGEAANLTIVSFNIWFINLGFVFWEEGYKNLDLG